MLQKIKAFFGYHGQGTKGVHVDLEQQIDIATKIIAMLDKARAERRPVKIFFDLEGEDVAGIICAGHGDRILDWIYQAISGQRMNDLIELQVRDITADKLNITVTRPNA